VSRRIEPNDVSVVIPVRDDEPRLLRLVTHLMRLPVRPAEVVVVDNDSTIPLDRQGGPVRNHPVVLTRCDRPGPAAARNVGWRRATRDWVLFTDSDCVPGPSFVSGYAREATNAVAFAGGVEALGCDRYSRYYERQKILMPPEDEARCPTYLVTANCLVARSALLQVGGFDETFPLAGGEDIDLGVRLRAVGRVEFNLDSTVKHDFEASLRSFVRRFRRYGFGNGLVAQKLGQDLRPELFSPLDRSASSMGLALVQFFAMTYGYEAARRGVPSGWM
jgi:GT2 family glycosyltransferase